MDHLIASEMVYLDQAGVYRYQEIQLASPLH